MLFPLNFPIKPIIKNEQLLAENCAFIIDDDLALIIKII